MHLLVCYDISDDRRRTRLSKALEAFGDRVQYSVFRCDLDAAQIRRLRRRILSIIDPTEDLVRIEKVSATPVWSFGTCLQPTPQWVI